MQSILLSNRVTVYIHSLEYLEWIFNLDCFLIYHVFLLYFWQKLYDV